MHLAHNGDNQLIGSSLSSSTQSGIEEQQAAAALLALGNPAPLALDPPQLSVQQVAAALLALGTPAPPSLGPPQFSDQQAAAVLISLSTATPYDPTLPPRTARGHLRQPQHGHRVSGRTPLQRKNKSPTEAAQLVSVNGIVTPSKLHGQQPP